MKNKSSKNTIPEPFPLEERLNNYHIAHTTNLQATINIIKDIVLMPFSDFMFFHPEEYRCVMKEFTSHHYETNFPEIPTGLVFEFLVSETGMSPKAMIARTEQERHLRELLLQGIYQPFLDTYDIANTIGKAPDPFPSSVKSPNDLIEHSSWKYVNKQSSSYGIYKNRTGVSLEKRIQHIKTGKLFKASAYAANAHHFLIPSEMGFPFYQFLYSTTFEDYLKSLKSLSLTRISPTRILCNKLAQAHPSYDPGKAILEYYIEQPRKAFESSLYALFIYPMAQVSITLRKKGYIKC